MNVWRRSLLAIVGFFLLILAGCKPSVPSQYISPDDLEDLLYDYHLADAMAQQAPGDYAQNAIAYRAAVLKKHQVTQVEFDSSMVYYMRHADVLHDIYEDLAKRLEEDVEAMGGTGGAIAITGSSASGDTVDIWQGPRSLALIPVVPYNSHSFEFKTDSTVHKGDAFLLSFRSDFIFQDGSRDGVALLAVVFGNDSTTSQVMHLSSPQQMTLTVEDRDSLGVKAIKGFFMLNKSQLGNSSSTTLQLMSIGGIHLWRCHRKAVPGTAVTSARPDSPVPASSPAARRPDASQAARPDTSSPTAPQLSSPSTAPKAPSVRLQQLKREQMTR
jgi:hypothetical protein